MLSKYVNGRLRSLRDRRALAKLEVEREERKKRRRRRLKATGE